MGLLRRRLRFLSHFGDKIDDQLGLCADLLIEQPASRLEEIIRRPSGLVARNICAQTPHKVIRLLIDQASTWASEFTVRVLACRDIVGEVHRTHDLGADPHLTGVPIALETNKGVFVYKPRSVVMDRLYNELVGILCESGLKYPPGRLNVSVKSGYGFIEYVQSDPSPVSISTEQFQMVGTMLAITYALCGTDFHYENIVFSHGRAFLVDLEGLFQPTISDSGEVASDTLSVLNTGILPARVISGNSFDFDPSVIGSRRFQFSCSYSTAMRSLLEGFQDTYMIFQTSRGQITQSDTFRGFSRAISRYISGQTIDYYRVLARLAKSIRTTIEFGDERDRLDRLFSGIGPDDPFVDFEKEALSRFCIPVFLHSIDSSTIVTEVGNNVSVTVERDGLTTSKQRLSTLSRADLRRQSWFIQCAFECNALNEKIKFQPSDELSKFSAAGLLETENLIAHLTQFISNCCKVSPSGTCFIVVPIYDKGQWRLHNRRLKKQENKVLTDLLDLSSAFKCNSIETSLMTENLMSLAKKTAAAIIDQSEIEHRILALTKLDRAESSPYFFISNTEGPCSIVTSEFLNEERLTLERCAFFLRLLFEAITRGNLRYGGIFQVPCLYFSIGIPCLLLVLCIVKLSISQHEAEAVNLNFNSY